jgi:outer membrane protein
MRVLIALSVVVLSGSPPVWSQTTPPEVPPTLRLTLDEALARATKESHRLAELRARQAASEAATTQRRVADLPVVSLQAGYQRTNHVDEFGIRQPDGRLNVFYPDVPDNWHSRLDMQWPIYTGGRSRALERAAAAERDATAKDLDAARADLRLETTRAYWALVTAVDAHRVVAESMTRIEAQLHDVKARFDAGFLPPNDVLTTETRFLQQRTLLIQAANQRDGARADLARLIGAPLDTAIEADAQLAQAGDQVTTAIPSAPVHRAEHDALTLRADAADARVAAARSDRRPLIALASGYDYARPNPHIFPRKDVWQDSWDIGMNMTWTLWNGGRTTAQVAEARALADAARERVAELDTQIALEVRQHTLDLESARAQLEPAEAAIRSAVEARRVVQERFTAGVATTTDLLDAQVDELQAGLERTRALAGIRLAEARLARALGH